VILLYLSVNLERKVSQAEITDVVAIEFCVKVCEKTTFEPNAFGATAKLSDPIRINAISAALNLISKS
jgi:hypothetical protein